MKVLSLSKYSIRFLGGMCLILLMAGCGAQLKGAADVEEIFQGETLTLAGKVAKICSNMTSGQKGPSLLGISQAQAGCAQPGAKAQNLETLTKFEFSSVESSGTKFTTAAPPTTNENTTRKINFRAELWMGTSIIGVAGKLLTALKNGTLTKAKDNKPVKDEIKIVNGPIIDRDQLRIQAQIDFYSPATANGAADIHNLINIDAMKMDNAFVATAEFRPEMNSKVSLVKNLKAVVFIVPHAQDIYINLMIDAEFHSYGVGSSVEQNVINKVKEAVEVQLKDIMEY